MILLNAHSRVSVEQTFLNLIGISAPPAPSKYTASSIFSGKIWKAFILRSVIKQECLLLPLVFTI